METSRLAPAPRDVRPDGLPWPSLLVLGSGTLLMVTAEMLPTAVLGPMSAGLGVAESSTGLLVSVWAAVVVVLSFPLVRLTRRWERRAVIAGGLAVLALSSALTALAPVYALAVGARLLGAAAVGLLWATTNAYVADLVPDRLLGRAVAVVLGGATLGMVVGTPLARLVADVAGWRTAFGALAVLSLLGAVAVRAVVPRAVAAAGGAPGAGTTPGALPRATRLLMVTGLVALVLVGHYGAYTYVTRLAETPAQLLPGGISTLLLVFGLASAAGVALAGRVGEHSERALVVSVAATAAALAGLAVADAAPLLGVVVVAAWGVVSGGMPPFAQTLILRLAGPERRAFAGALIPVLFNGGIAVGAALASSVVATAGLAAVPPLAAGVVAVAAVALALPPTALLRRGGHPTAR
ncbi:MFS transporter [Promicromonospora citrea]|uniref:MFS transporter n=2 Tax=Promicromonospora citrea TaxID=43677 RepID=A0A8H9GG08_9MICO|nr:MFS transporter [Promicromonospora citrea]GGM22023.1 MFS transporter [Promicromonospora citrea]